MDNYPGGPEGYGSVSAYVRSCQLDSKFNKYLSKGTGGWRSAATKASILHHATLELEDRLRVPPARANTAKYPDTERQLTTEWKEKRRQRRKVSPRWLQV